MLFVSVISLILISFNQCKKKSSQDVSSVPKPIGSIPYLRLFEKDKRNNGLVGFQDYSKRKGDLIRVYELPEGWTNCGSEQDIFQFDLMHISPLPPQRNKNATIRIAGNLREDIQGNVQVEYLLKYGALPIVKDTIDACELIKEYPSIPQCPLKAGYYDVSYEDLIPMATPMGTYTIHAKGYLPLEDGSKKPLFCVEGVVVIKLFNPETKQFFEAADYP